MPASGQSADARTPHLCAFVLVDMLACDDCGRLAHEACETCWHARCKRCKEKTDA